MQLNGEIGRTALTALVQRHFELPRGGRFPVTILLGDVTHIQDGVVLPGHGLLEW